jgi:hypothetical protein
MIECIRMCEDIVEVGEALLAVAPRSSRCTADLARTFARVARACARECGQHRESRRDAPTPDTSADRRGRVALRSSPYSDVSGLEIHDFGDPVNR